MTSVLKKTNSPIVKSFSMQEENEVQKRNSHNARRAEDADKLVHYIDENIIGKGTSFCGPFGRRKVVYCDYSGCGRSLHFLEEHISREALPTHASACAASTATSLQTRLYKREARSFAMSACGGAAGDFALLGADPPRVSRALGLSHAPHSQQTPIVFVGRGESERGRAPWRDLGATVIKIPETKEGFIDLNVLETKLQQHSKSGRKLIGYFAAASKLTGALADDVATTILLHQYGALAFWDYSLAAPNADINMNPSFPGVENDMVEKDAVFFNCEKFVGGVQAPLIAVVKKHIFKDNSLYTDDLERLSECVEECDGTAAARAALVLQLRDAVGLQHIATHNDAITRQVLSHIRNLPELILLGNDSPTVRRLPIFSLLVKHPRGTFLHHNFICAVLNDVFGIQARGGLSGNLSYGHELLGIDEQLFREYEKVLNVDLQTHLRSTTKPGEDAIQYFEHLRPGFFRISLPFFTSESELAFILEALKMVATEGWKILPQYVVNPVNGQWRHHSNAVLKDRKSVMSIHYVDGKMISHERRISGPGIFPQTFTECLQTARNLFNQARKLALKCSLEEQVITFNARIDYLRWFMLPKEAHDLLLGKSSNVKNIVPFDPFGYTGARKSLHTLCRSSQTSSPVYGSARHYSLSAIDDSLSAIRAKQRQKYFSQEESVTEKEIATQESIILENVQAAPVQFAVGGSVSPVNLRSQADIPLEPQIMTRMRCYSLGSESPPTALSPHTRYKLGLSTVSSSKKLDFCHCGSQTDLLSLDDPMISPRSSYGYNNQDSTSNSDCSQIGRISPPASLNSEELSAYVKEMTKEIATELKSEIREVISQVEDVLENSDSLELTNLSTHSNASNASRDSVSVIDVAEYLMGVSREMASEVKYEIREMVNQVDEMISPELYASSQSSLNHYRKSPPADPLRCRVTPGTNLQLSLSDTLNKNPVFLRKCLTSPLLLSPNVSEMHQEDNYFLNESKSPKRNGILLSPKSAQSSSPHENVSFNSSETSTPETIIQVLSKDTVGGIPKSSSVTKFSDDEACCQETICRPYCKNNGWCQYNTVSSHDSGINMTFPETDSFQTYVKCRTSSDPTGQKRKKQIKYKSGCSSLRREKSEVPDIIEGVPVCSGDYQACQQREADKNRVVFQCDDIDGDSRKSSRSSITDSNSKRSSHSSLNGSEPSDYSSGYGKRTSPLSTASIDDPRIVDPSFCSQLGSSVDEDGRMSESSISTSTSTDSSEYLFHEDSKWHCPPKAVWKSTVEAIQEFNMIRDQDKVLVCLSGGQHSMALLHTLHQYQFYARAKGIHFSIGAIFVREPSCEIDPMHLMAYCRTLGVKFIYEDNKIDGQDLHSDKCGGAGADPVESCRWASHEARRGVYSAAAQHGYTTAAVAQHLADVARAFLAAAFHAGTLRAMKAHYFVREYNLRIVRPFIYVRENCLQQFVESRRLPDLRHEARLKLTSATHYDTSEGTSDLHEENSDTLDSCSLDVLQPRDRSISAPQPTTSPLVAGVTSYTTKSRSRSEPAGGVAADLLQYHEKVFPSLFASLKSALHPLITSKNSIKEIKEHRNRKKSVIQMKNGAPVYDSDEGTDEEAVP